MIKEFHIHLYYSEENIEVAKEVAGLVKNKFDVDVGRFHERPVGPHPMWSVQLLVKKEDFGEVLGFVSLNRKGLVVFSHPVTGDDLIDHTDAAIWMGKMIELKLDGFRKK